MTDDATAAGTGPGRSDAAFGVIAGLLAWGLLLANTAAWRGQHDLENRRATRRYWEDLSIAAAAYLNRGEPKVESVSIAEIAGQSLRGDYQRYVTRMALADPIQPWQFWRTVPLKPYLKRERIHGRPSDDTGRSRLLFLGFWLVGGVAPFLPLWIGALVALPFLLWTAIELSLAGRRTAALVFGLVFASSPYAVDMLALPYSAAGFYLLGLVGVTPLSTYAVFGPGRSMLVFLLRVLLAGTAFALCTLCRGGAVLFLPGFLLAITFAVFRLQTSHRRRTLFLAAAAALFLLPYAVMKPSGHHEIWLGVWEGLGDFDRTKGHVWYDPVAREILRQDGTVIPRRLPVFHEAMANEHIFKRRVLEHVRGDPLWFATILAKRFLATVSQWRLWPRTAVDGTSFAPRSAPNEGAIDTYYGLTTTADWVGLGPWRLELPALLLLLPTLAVVGALVFRRGQGLGSAGELKVLMCLASAGLVLPVLVTTASALETQSFVVVYLLGLAFLADAAVCRRWRRSAAVGG